MGTCLKFILIFPSFLLSFNCASQNIDKAQLLQGKWQSVDDKTNFLVFENNQRREIAGGMKDWNSEDYILSDQCLNESDKHSNKAEKDRYINCKKSDLCWYIISLNDKSLTLQYIPRGNLLIYKRVKSKT